MKIQTIFDTQKCLGYLIYHINLKQLGHLRSAEEKLRRLIESILCDELRKGFCAKLKNMAR